MSNKQKLGASSLAVLMVSVLCIPAATAAGAALPAGVTAWVRVDAGQVPLVQGDVLSVGAVKAQAGGCTLPGNVGIEITVDVSNPNVRSASVMWHFDDACRVVIEAVSATTSPAEDSPPPFGDITTPLVTSETSSGDSAADAKSTWAGRGAVSPQSAGTRHRHNGWAKSTVYEQFGVTATEVYSYLTYYQATTPTKYVDDGYNYGNSYCYHSVFPGWSTDRCVFEVLDLTGPGDVAVKVDARFSHLLATYSESSRFRAVKSGDWNYSCTLYDGTLPPLWDEVCTGGRSGPF